MKRNLKIRAATEEAASIISESIEEWLRWSVPREQSIRKAVKNKELFVADMEGRVEGFIHCVPHEDIIDGGLNFFITCFYVSPERRAEGVGSALLDAVVRDAVDRGALGVETSTAVRMLGDCTNGTVSDSSRAIGRWEKCSLNST